MPNRRDAKLVELEHAGIYRSGRWLVQDVTMDVKCGEIVTLIGPNGAGKTTTAKMALGVIDIDAGRTQRQQNLTVGYVPQRISIDWTLPLNVERFLHLTHHCSESDIKLALKVTGISHLAKAQIMNLSGGEFQRLLIARAIVKRPRLLVLDEPVRGVDYTGEMALYKLIETIRNDLNCGILLISHDLHVVMSTTDRVICLNGHVCCSGTPKNVTASSEFKSLFGQRIASSLALYDHNHDHKHGLNGSVEDLSNNSEQHNSSCEVDIQDA